jgi:hypothetical protein
MSSPPRNAPTGSNYQQYPWQELGPSLYCDELEHIHTFCSDVRTDQENRIVRLNEPGGLTLGPGGGTGGEISRYRPERRFLSVREYSQEVA